MAFEYKRARKKEKGKILDTVIELSGYNRSYAPGLPAAGRVLRDSGPDLRYWEGGNSEGSLSPWSKTNGRGRKKKPRRRPRVKGGHNTYLFGDEPRIMPLSFDSVL